MDSSHTLGFPEIALFQMYTYIYVYIIYVFTLNNNIIATHIYAKSD